jgi:hypothetical protein
LSFRPQKPSLYRRRARWGKISASARPRWRRVAPCNHRPTSVGESRRSADIGRKKAATKQLVWPFVKWQRHGRSLRSARISHGLTVCRPIRKAPKARRPVRQMGGIVSALGEAARPRTIAHSRTLLRRARNVRRSVCVATTSDVIGGRGRSTQPMHWQIAKTRQRRKTRAPTNVLLW